MRDAGSRTTGDCNRHGFGNRTLACSSIRFSGGPCNGDRTSKSTSALIEQSHHNEGGSCLPLALDVSDEQSVVEGLKTLSGGKVDILINNAGVTSFKDFSDMSVREFDAIIDTNLRGLFLMTRQVLPGMLKRRKGIIVNILSFAAKTVYTGSSVYSASKAGAEALMNGLRAEVRGRGIKVVNVFPGAVETPMWSPGARKRFRNDMMNANELADLVFHSTLHANTMMLEEIVMRPQIGDLTL